MKLSNIAFASNIKAAIEASEKRRKITRNKGESCEHVIIFIISENIN